MTTTDPVYTSGEVSSRVGLPRWRMLYLIERGTLPGPSLSVPGRRLFTEADVQGIEAVLASHPRLSYTPKSPTVGDEERGKGLP